MSANVMTNPYNYANFSFALEDGADERWLAEAPALGQVAPDFVLTDLRGIDHRLSGLLGRPVVLEFGSYTCPIFCAQIPPMRALAAGHPEAAFVVVYTREAHPGERTPAHASSDAKEAAARQLETDEQLDRTLLIDDVDGSTHRAYGGCWDSVFVLDSAARVVLRRSWNDPTQVDAALTALATNEPWASAESVDMVPVVGRGGMGHGLLRGGRQALFDFYDSAPPPVQQRLEQSDSAEVRQLLAVARDGGGA